MSSLASQAWTRTGWRSSSRSIPLNRPPADRAPLQHDSYEQLTAMIGSRWLADMTGALQLLPYHWARAALRRKRTLHRIGQLLTVSPGLATHHEVVASQLREVDEVTDMI